MKGCSVLSFFPKKKKTTAREGEGQMMLAAILCMDKEYRRPLGDAHQAEGQ